MYADASPAVIRCGWGLERNRNGGNAAAAILALPAVAGKFGVRGGGYTLSNSGSWGITKSWIGADEPPTRLVNMNHLGRMLTGPADPPVKVLFVYNCNPLSTAPHQNLVRQGLERDDLTTIVFDQVMSDTARFADIVLPATTFLEQYDLARAYGPISLQMVRPVVDAVGEARPNVDVFAELEQRLGLDQSRRTARRAGDDDPRHRRASRRRGRRGQDGCTGGASVRHGPGSVRRRVPSHARRKGPPLSGGPRRPGAAGPLYVSAGPGDRPVSAGAHLAVEREGHLLVAL